MQESLSYQNIVAQVDQLIALCLQLTEENRNLRKAQHELFTERAHLLAKNEQARIRVETMITRLKSLEHQL